MVRRILALASVLTLLTCALACKDGGSGATAADGGKAVKLICKMNNQCWICPDDAAMKKCILNPVTSGCKQSSAGECQP